MCRHTPYKINCHSRKVLHCKKSENPGKTLHPHCDGSSLFARPEEAKTDPSVC